MVEILSDIRQAIQSMTPPLRGEVVKNAEDVSSLLKAIYSAELVAKSTSIEAVKAAAEAEIHRLLGDLRK
jgi:ABC-type amino acid transport system permease subunit